MGHNQKKDTHTLEFGVTPLLGLKQLTPLIPLRQDLFAKNVLMTAQRDFCFGNSPSSSDLVYQDVGLPDRFGDPIY